MINWRQAVKRTLLQPTRFGLVKSALASMNHGKARILMYHRVTDKLGPYDAPYNAVTVESFEQQTSWLEHNCNVIPLDLLVEKLQSGGDLPPEAVVITFDDGFKDNYDNAFPVLKRKGLAATIYVCAEIIGTTKRLWFDRASAILNATKKSSFSYPLLSESSFDLVGGMFAAHYNTHQKLKELSPQVRDEALDSLASFLEVDESLWEHADNPAMMSWDDLREMQESGITIGAHTMTHPILSRLDDATLRREVLDCKQVIEDKLRRPVHHFSYPNGTPADYDQRTMELVKANYQSATTTVSGLAFADSDPYQLPRIHVDDEFSLFPGKLELPFLSRCSGSNVEIYARN